MTAPALLGALLCFAVPAVAEFRSITIDYAGQECASCSATLTKVIQKLRGVSAVTVDPQRPTVAIELAAGNRVPLSDIRDAIKRVGFTPGEARVVVRGQLMEESGKRLLKPHGLDQVLELQAAEPFAAAAGVEVEGAIPPSAPGARDTLIAKITRSE
jgi:copper chaperone CopZ